MTRSTRRRATGKTAALARPEATGRLRGCVAAGAVAVLWVGMFSATATAEEPVVLREWSFAHGLQGWTGNNTTPLRIEDGALVFEPTAADVFIAGPPIALKPEHGDVLEIRIKSTTAGECEWFWRGAREGQSVGYNPRMRRSVGIGAGEHWQVLRTWPFWQDMDEITSVRFDPPEGKPGRYAVAFIRILRTGLARGQEGEFMFTAGQQGWWVSGGGAEETPDGLRVRLEGPSARLQSPPLEVDAGRSGYLVLDVTVPAGVGRETIPAVVEFLAGGVTSLPARPFLLAPGRRATYSIRMEGWPGWAGRVLGLQVGTGLDGPLEVVMHSLRVSPQPADPAPGEAATGLAVQTEVWRTEARLAAAPPRIDVARQVPPETNPVHGDFTVAMWYFAAWEPEYTWDGWRQVAERSPWRLPLLYDSADPDMEYNGIRFYRAGSPRVIDWHVHWMREHAVNLMLWDWYSKLTDDGRLDPGFFANRALEIGYLGKEQVGGPPVATNRFAGKMDFAVMWTNHGPHHHIGSGLWRYIVEQFFSQPNYYRLDDKPLLVLWSLPLLVQQAGGPEAARAQMDELRRLASENGHRGVYIAVIDKFGADRDLMSRVGIDGVTGYAYAGSGGYRMEQRRVADRLVSDQLEDYVTQTIPGHVGRWTSLADTYGREYLLATTPMQNWEPTFRAGNQVMQHHTPDAYREMLMRAKVFIQERGLRPFVNIEAWNEWLEGSYVEPSTQWGMSYLEAIRDTFAARE